MFSDNEVLEIVGGPKDGEQILMIPGRDIFQVVSKTDQVVIVHTYMVAQSPKRKFLKYRGHRKLTLPQLQKF